MMTLRRWRVEIEIACDDDEVLAETATEAEGIARARVEDSGSGVYATSVRAHEIVYQRPAGTDRWGAVADEIRFAESDPRWFPDAADGVWWWTNGHVALKCTGLPPTADESRCLPRCLDELTAGERRVIEWGPRRRDDEVDVRSVLDDPRVSVDDRYARLVELGAGGEPIRWMGAGRDADAPATVPILAYVGDECIAVVAGRRERK
jgi:hypothetical protein